jgi:hypothetical protein
MDFRHFTGGGKMFGECFVCDFEGQVAHVQNGHMRENHDAPARASSSQT